MSEVNDLKARAVELLRNAGLGVSARKLENGERSPAEVLRIIREWFLNEPIGAADAAAIAAVEALVVAERPASADLAHASGALAEARARCDELREQLRQAHAICAGAPHESAVEAVQRTRERRDALEAELAAARGERSAIERTLLALARSHKELIAHVRTTAASPPGEFASDAVSRVVRERNATQATLDEALAIQSQIWDAVGGQREGETLVDAVKRRIRDLEILLGWEKPNGEEAKDTAADHDTDCCCVDCSAVMEPPLRAICERGLRSLPKPAAVGTGQWWLRDGERGVFQYPARILRIDGKWTDMETERCGRCSVANADMIGDPRWVYLGDGEREIGNAAVLKHWADKTSDEIAQWAEEAEGDNPRHASWCRGVAAGIREGERRAEEKARATARGLVDVWTRRSERHHEQSEADRDRGYKEGENRYYGRAAAHERCANDLRAAFNLPAADKPPTGGEPAPVDERRVPTADEVARMTPVQQRACSGLVASADERWQPGAVWEHRADVVRRLELRQIDEVRGVAFLCVVGTWNGTQSVPRADMTEANGWRYVGPASEVATVERGIANAPTAPARTGEANPGGANTGAAGAGESVARESDGASRVPKIGDIVNLRVSKGVHPCVVLHVWNDGSVNLRDLFDLEEVESRPRDDSGSRLGTWRFRD